MTDPEITCVDKRWDKPQDQVLFYFTRNYYCDLQLV